MIWYDKIFLMHVTCNLFVGNSKLYILNAYSLDGVPRL